MATLQGKYGKLLTCVWKSPFVSKNVLLLRGSNLIKRPPCQVRFVSESTEGERDTRKRDKLTVLKALASTVARTPHRPTDHRFIDDMMLNPRTVRMKKEVLLAIEHGEKAADYILETYAHLFPLRKPEPAWPLKTDVLPVTEVSVNDLRRLIKSGKSIPKAVEWYNILCSTDDLSLDVHNEMLDFVTFHAVSCDEDKNVILKEDDESNWGEDMFADKLFTELKDKGNGRTYEVYILGLLKHKEINKAFNVYRELTEKNMSGSLYMYNTLLAHVVTMADSDQDRWNLAQDIARVMQQNNIKPNVTTFNELMAIAAEKRDGAGVLCLQLLREMKKLKISPSLGSYYYLILADRREHLMEESLLSAILLDLNNGVVKYVLQHPSDVKFFVSAMELARYKRRADLAREIFNIVMDNKIDHLVGDMRKPFFGNFLSTIARHSTIDELMTEYHKLVPGIFIPGDWVYEQIFFAFYHHNHLTHLPSLYADMVSLKVAASQKRIYTMFYAMSRDIPKDQTEEFYNIIIDSEFWMKAFKIRHTTETMSASIRVLCLCDRYDEVMEKVEECNTLNIVPNGDAMFAILELTINHKVKKDALITLKAIANEKIKLTDNMSQLVFNNDLLASEVKVIRSWFAK